MTHSQITSFLWSVADLIRDTFKRGKYQDVILPLTVLRRIDQVLEPTKEKVLKTYSEYKGKLDNPDDLLRKASGYAFYNTSLYTFERLVDDPQNIAHNLRTYIQSFSPNMREAIEKFDFDNTITKLDDAGLLFQVMERFAQVDLHPDRVSNPMMGTIFEELIRKFNEALNENPGEHFTPRDVVHLMVRLLVEGEDDKLGRERPIVTVHDPCCGTGGMLTITKDVIQGSPKLEGLNPNADVHLFGQEVNPETFAICKADLFIKGDGSDADNILYGSTLAVDRHAGRGFDYMIANPPYGKDWKRDEQAVKAEADRGTAGRFEAGTPRISDGQLLFLQHMVHHMKPPEEGGSRIAIIMNGSPLFTGDAGSGESEIRRWILENDWLDALIALPEQLFYNTGIATYVWVLSNRKPAQRRGKVQLIDATDLWVPMRKSLGDKRREISDEHHATILELYRAYEPDAERSKVFPTEEFGFRKIRVEQPLRLNFQASDERIARLDDERAFQNLAKSSKRDSDKKRKEIEEGRKLQEAIRAILRSMPDKLFKDRTEFRKALKQVAKDADRELSAPLLKAIESALSEPDETAEICRDAKGNPESDREFRDYENVPLGKDIDAYFEREVKPYVPDAWIDESYTDSRDRRVGRVGYEINFNRYFYVYEPPRSLEEIEADIRAIEKEIVGMLGGGGGVSASVASERAVLPWLEDLPEGWDMVEARRLFRERKKTGCEDRPLLSVTQGNGVLARDESEIRVWNPGAAISGYKLVLPGDFVISLRSFQGGFERSEIEGLVSPAYTPFYSATLSAPQLEFLRHYFKSAPFVSSLEPLTSGIRQGKNISFADFGESLLPIPPSEDAQSIASFLDRETARIDTLIERKRRLLDLLDEKRKALIRRTVTRGLDPDVPMKDSGVEWIGEIPEHWEISNAKAMFELHRGFDLPESERQQGTVPVVSSGGIVGSHDKANSPGPGVVTGRYGSVGSVYYVDQPYWPLNTALYVRRFRGNHPRYVFYLLRLLPVLQYAAKSAVPGVDRKDVHKERIPFPRLPEQIAIAEQLTSFETDLAVIRDRLDTAISLLQEYRTALISAAVTGRIDVIE